MDLPFEPTSIYEYAAMAHEAGYVRVIGVDEVGRGPLAGPVVAAAAFLPPGVEIDGLNDSKQLTAKKRELLYHIITNHAEIEYAFCSLDAEVVDEINIYQATCKAMRKCSSELKPDFILVDGKPVRDLPAPSKAIVKGDAKCASIAAASIIAKVWRDRLMEQYEQEYPGYGFARHKGYGTKVHLEALQKLGPTPIHRRSFSPVAACLPDALKQQEFTF